MPETASAERERLGREAARRRLVTMLEISAATCTYAASQLSNGIGPVEARATALFTAGELATVAEALRRLTVLEPGERRELAVRLASAGWSRQEIAVRVGVSESAVVNYLRSGDGG